MATSTQHIRIFSLPLRVFRATIPASHYIPYASFQLMHVHNTCVSENDLFVSVLLCCPSWALCFNPPTQIHINCNSTDLSSSLSTAPLYVSYHCISINLEHTQHIACPWLAHHFRSLSVVFPPFSLFALSHSQVHISISCYVSAHSGNLVLSAVPFSFLYWLSSYSCLSVVSLLTVSLL